MSPAPTHLFNRIFRLVAAAAMAAAASACVHQWPEGERAHRDVRLHISHSLEWTQHDFDAARGAAQLPTLARYHMQVYAAGAVGRPVFEREFTCTDLGRADFDHTLHLPPGAYVLHCWSDCAHAATGASHFFDSSDFSKISYTHPYNGNNELRDAFRGTCEFVVDPRIDADYAVAAELPMERPLARYEFVSTDLVDFLEGEDSRGMLHYGRADRPADVAAQLPQFGQYRVRMLYTGYMPTTFNNLTNKPVDSATGVEYDASITVLNDTEALLGFDHVMVNGAESSVAVALEIYDPTGALIGRVPTVNVPTRRGRNTTVRGRFLTSKAQGGVGIDPGFEGEFNIEIK